VNGQATAKPLPGGQLDSDDVVWNAFNGLSMLKENATNAQDWRDRTRPGANQFMLSVPTWDLTDPKKSNSMLGFGYDAKVDPALDSQTRQVTQGFLREFMDDLGKPGARGTNLTTQVPANLQFDVPVKVKGESFRVTYNGGDKVTATGADGKPHEVKLGKQKIEAMWLDNQAFGDLGAQLSEALGNPRSVRPSWLPF
jgi:NTE family protein